MNVVAISGLVIAVATLITACAAGYANVLKTRADREEARAARDREDDDARFSELRSLLDEYRQAHTRDAAARDGDAQRIARLEETVEKQAAQIAGLQTRDAECQRRLRQAEQKLKSLGA